MTAYVALLRAVNLGADSTLPMADLRAMATEIGFAAVRTFIASGNLLFEADADEASVKARLEARLAVYAGRPLPVMVRSAAEMVEVLASNPFAEEPGNWTVAVFLDAAPPADAVERATGWNGERTALGRREIYIAYGAGMGRSKLRMPAAMVGTARNMNTVRKLVEMMQ